MTGRDDSPVTAVGAIPTTISRSIPEDSRTHSVPTPTPTTSEGTALLTRSPTSIPFLPGKCSRQPSASDYLGDHGQVERRWFDCQLELLLQLLRIPGPFRTHQRELNPPRAVFSHPDTSVQDAHVGAHTIMGGTLRSFCGLCPLLTSFRSNITGLCSNGAAAPDCVPGPKWTSNEPLILHHPVRVIFSTRFVAILPRGLPRWLTRSGTTGKTGMAGTSMRMEEPPSTQPQPSQASSNSRTA